MSKDTTRARRRAVSPRNQLGDFLSAHVAEGVLKVHMDSEGEARDFDCFLCGRNYDLFSKKGLTAAAFVAAHLKSCRLSNARTS